MLQLQIVVVDKTAAAADVVDVLIHQHAGTELRLVMFQEGSVDGIPQQSGKKAGAVSVIPPGHYSREGDYQPALRGNLYNCGLAVVRKRISRNGLHRLQNSGGILPELDGSIFCRPNSVQKKLLSIGIRILHRLSSFRVSDRVYRHVLHIPS